MQNIKYFKLINIGLVTVTVLIATITWIYWKTVCATTGCDSILREYTLRPLLWGSIAWAIISGTLLFFPASVFKKWLFHIGILGMFFMIYCILNTDPHASSFWLDIDRGRAAWASGVVVALVTGLYIMGSYLFSWVKTKTTPTTWYQLLVLIPAALVMYYFAVM
jgi:hypothetical protein